MIAIPFTPPATRSVGSNNKLYTKDKTKSEISNIAILLASFFLFNFFITFSTNISIIHLQKPHRHLLLQRMNVDLFREYLLLIYSNPL